MIVVEAISAAGFVFSSTIIFKTKNYNKIWEKEFSNK